LQLTWIIRDMIYPVKTKKKKPVKRPEGYDRNSIVLASDPAN
jgi:hypothetical protein